MLHCLLALVTLGPQESKGERKAPCSQKLINNNDGIIFNTLYTRPIMNLKTCSRLIPHALRTSHSPVRCSILPFDKGWRSFIGTLVRNGVPCQCRNNCHLKHSIRPTLKLPNTCFDERPQTEPWPQGMMEDQSTGQGDHMR